MPTSRKPTGLRSETVRRRNLSAILRELHLHGPLSRSDLVARTGLTRSAIRTLIGEFVATGLVSEERSVPLGTPGRPSPLVRPDPQNAIVLAVHVAVDSLSVALVGIGGAILDLARSDRRRGHLSIDETVADLTELAAPLLEKPLATGALIGVGVAIAGVVRRSDGRVRMAPNLGWHDEPFGERLTEALRLSVPVSMANEADLGALAEHRRGVAVGVDDVVYIHGEVGVGGGVIVNGQPLAGAEGYGGEVGHFPVNPAGVPCGCGSVGCWETEIGERALLARAGRSPDGGRAAVEAVISAAEKGSSRPLKALEDIGTWLGVGLAGLVNVFNPRMVVLGGLLAGIQPFVVDTLTATLDARGLRPSRELVQVVPAALGPDAPLLGAAELAFEPLLADPAAWLVARDGVLQLASA